MDRIGVGVAGGAGVELPAGVDGTGVELPILVGPGSGVPNTAVKVEKRASLLEFGF
jgi:hypothetical protein